MIGVFDSGFGGLQTLKYLKNYFLEEDFLFLADSQYVPYGEKSVDEIRTYSTRCINRLADQGCEIIVIACNTAVAGLYSDRQYHCSKHALIGVTYAGLQEVVKGPYRHIGVLCTKATNDLKVYQTVYDSLRGEAELCVVPSPELVPLIESNCQDEKLIVETICTYVGKLPKETDCIILGCTHYPVYISYFWEYFPQCKIIDPGRSSIHAIARHIRQSHYLETPRRNDQKRKIQIFCTGDPVIFRSGASRIRKGDIEIHHACI